MFANATESFAALAQRLHTNPTKLCEYNFLHDCQKDLKPGDSIRVPYDQCTPKTGVWNCYQVKKGDTLLSVATSPGSFVADPEKLKNFNLDILYGDLKLYPGQHLRLPIHNCFEDGFHTCHTVDSSNETLVSVSAAYNMTPEALCKANGGTFGRNYCDPAFEPLPCLLVGMELSVSRLHLVQPLPCQEIPGSWTCYTVKEKDILFDLVPVLNNSEEDLIELNYGQHPPSCGNCSNVTECPPSLTDKQRGPGCLRIGQVLTARVPYSKPKPGVWKCLDYIADPGPCAWDESLSSLGTPLNNSFFCAANRDFDCDLDSTVVSSDGMNCFAGGWPKGCGWDFSSAVRMPQVQCVPNAQSYCSNDPSAAGNWSSYAIEQLRNWDGNALNFLGMDSMIGYPIGEFHIPRGSLPVAPGYWGTGCADSTEELVQCTPEPGKHICHKLLPPIQNSSGYNILWTDTVDQVAARFGVSATRLCELNKMKNCSKICFLSALKIPVSTPPPAPTPAMYSCNSTVGRCVADPRGSMSPAQCIDNCKCITPHNCGQLNGTVRCGEVVTKCSVCDMCCKPWLTQQASCDGCFNAPLPNGCGGKAQVF
jgi:hypothetical protein